MLPFYYCFHFNSTIVRKHTLCDFNCSKYGQACFMAEDMVCLVSMPHALGKSVYFVVGGGMS